MNDRFEPDSLATTLDRLVDGELRGDEYRQLLSNLEGQPDGWRRCAMAFLEAQAWKHELGALRREVDEPKFDQPTLDQPKSDPPRVTKNGWTWTYAGLISLASAASFLIAFLVAAYVYRTGDVGVDQMVVSRTTNEGGVTGQEGDLRNQVNRPVTSQNGSSQLAAAENAGQQPWGKYRLVVSGDDGTPREIEMPIFAADDPRASWLFDERATMPVELIRELEKMGFQVNRQRQWAPVGQEAGRPVIVPIEELRITPVSSRSYH